MFPEPHDANYGYQQPRRDARAQRSSRGCGCLGFTTLAVLLVIGLVGAVSMFVGPVNVPFTRQPIPDDVPPAVAEKPLQIDVHAPGRTAEQLTQWAQPISESTRIPLVALRAYANAELIATDSYPQCNLSWGTLAGLGQVETRHGTYTGDWLNPARIDADGVARPSIVGPPLDGEGGFAKVVDTDGGVLDGDTEFDRAVGPLQFIPETWHRYGVDASGDGVLDPHNIEDAAATSAKLLCANDRDLSTPEGWTEAIRAYNQSEKYVRDVRDAAANYALKQPA